MIKLNSKIYVNYLYAFLLFLGFETFYLYQIKIFAYVEIIISLLITISIIQYKKQIFHKTKRINEINFGISIILFHSILATISIFTAKLNFNQDIINSLISSRYLIVCYALILGTAYYCIFTDYSKQVIKILTIFSAIFCITYLIITLLDLDKYILLALNTEDSKIINFKDYSELFGRERFKITYIPAIYLILNSNNKHWKTFIFLGLITLFFAAAGRMLWLSLALTFALYGFKKHLTIGVVFTFFVVFIVFILNSANIVNFDAFYDAFNLLKNSGSSDMSLMVRAEEMEIAFEILKENMIWGVGSISYNQFDGGYDYFYGRYAPSDIGILGTMSIYGLPGVLLQFYALVKSCTYLKNRNIFWFYFFIFNIFGIFTGSVIFKPFSYLTLLSICLISENFRYIMKNNKYTYERPA